MRPPATPDVASETVARMSSGSFGFWEFANDVAGAVLSTWITRWAHVRLAAKSITQIANSFRPSWNGAVADMALASNSSWDTHGSNTSENVVPGIRWHVPGCLETRMPLAIATICWSPEPASELCTDRVRSCRIQPGLNIVPPSCSIRGSE